MQSDDISPGSDEFAGRREDELPEQGLDGGDRGGGARSHRSGIQVEFRTRIPSTREESPLLLRTPALLLRLRSRRLSRRRERRREAEAGGRIAAEGDVSELLGSVLDVAGNLTVRGLSSSFFPA